jgi:hypothetical protein
VKKGRILSKNVYETNPRNESLNTIDGFAKRIRIRDGTNPDFLRNEPKLTGYESTFLRTSYTIPASLVASRSALQSFFSFVPRGLYPNLVKENVRKNMETLAAVGLENYVIQGERRSQFLL